MDRYSPIGIMDSGVGGLTLVPELTKLLPGEDLIYFGDSANCPYGNRTQENILELSRATIAFLRERGVKVIAVACNTISALEKILNAENDIEIIGIVSPVCRTVAASSLREVGVFATNFTISTGAYETAIRQKNPNIRVWGKGSPNLASLVDQGKDNAQIDAEIRAELGALLEEHPVEDVILGCTHFPIVADRFAACFPQVRYINPAEALAASVQEYLSGKDLLSDRNSPGNFAVFSSGDTGIYRDVLKKIGARAPDSAQTI